MVMSRAQGAQDASCTACNQISSLRIDAAKYLHALSEQATVKYPTGCAKLFPFASLAQP